MINERIRDFEQLGGWPEDNTKQRPFLDMLIEIRKEKGLGYEDIREEVDTFMFEGDNFYCLLECLPNSPHEFGEYIQIIVYIISALNRVY